MVRVFREKGKNIQEYIRYSEWNKKVYVLENDKKNRYSLHQIIKAEEF